MARTGAPGSGSTVDQRRAIICALGLCGRRLSVFTVVFGLINASGLGVAALFHQHNVKLVLY